MIDHRWWISVMEEILKEIALGYFRKIGFDWPVSFSIRSQYIGSSSFNILKIILFLHNFKDVHFTTLFWSIIETAQYE